MNSINNLISEIEAKGLQWDVGYTARTREARIWRWPYVIGRYITEDYESPEDMLRMALENADIEIESKD